MNSLVVTVAAAYTVLLCVTILPIVMTTVMNPNVFVASGSSGVQVVAVYQRSGCVMAFLIVLMLVMNQTIHAVSSQDWDGLEN